MNPRTEYLMRLLVEKAEEFVAEHTTTSLPKVSQAMCRRAQELVDKLKDDMSAGDTLAFNRHLVRLYCVIPRSMNGRDFIETDPARLDLRIRYEQEFVTNVTGAVNGIITRNGSPQNRYEAIIMENGLSVDAASEGDIAYIKGKMGHDAGKLIQAWKVANNPAQARYEKYKAERHITEEHTLWHGSTSGNFLSILTKGLTIRKSNRGMFGHGLYFARKFDKSRGYCSVLNSRWAHGNDSSALLALFSVATGRPLELSDSLTSLDPGCRQLDGYDSVWAHAGASLRNDEIVVYDDRACSIRYIVQTR